jgi:hypothetical protein
LQIETADVNLIGYREENQDRVAIVADERAVLLAVVDGMGGHAEGARAAETALTTLVGAFWQTPRPLFDPLGFLHLSLGRAHDEVVKLGANLGGILGSCRRQPCLSTAPAAPAGTNPRSQPRRVAAARRTDQ